MFRSLIKYLTEKEKRKILELERKITLENMKHELKLKRIQLEEECLKDGKVLPENFDKLAVEQMQKSWKDEFIMLILFFPIIISFLPEIQLAAAEGFKIMSIVPNWYMNLLIAIVVVTYGLRSAVRLLLTSNATKPPKINIFKTKNDKKELEETKDEKPIIEKEEQKIQEFEREK